MCRNNWSWDTKQIMNKLGSIDAFNTQSSVNISDAKVLINNFYARKWSDDLQGVPKLRTYRMFKTEPKCEEYLTLNLKKYERSMLCQLRFGILPLRLETGRYIGEPVDQRICKHCSLNAVEDEKHFMLDCEQYNAIRNNLFSEIIENTDFVSFNPIDKLCYLLNNAPRRTAKYVLKAYLCRRTSTYNR